MAGYPFASMPLELPRLRPCEWACATVERVEVACTALWVATVQTGMGQPPLHRWCPEYRDALAYAAEQANRHGPPLFDFATAEEG